MISAKEQLEHVCKEVARLMNKPAPKRKEDRKHYYAAIQLGFASIRSFELAGVEFDEKYKWLTNAGTLPTFFNSLMEVLKSR